MHCPLPLQSLLPPPTQHTTPSSKQTETEGSGAALLEEEEKANKKESMETSEGASTKASTAEESMETSGGEGEFDNILANFEVERKRHDPTIPTQVMDDIQRMKEGEDPAEDDNDEGGVASSDEEVVS